MPESSSIDEQFAALPDRVKAGLFRMLDAAATAHQCEGGLASAGDVLAKLQLIDIPDPAKHLIRATDQLVTALSLDMHVKRLRWAQAEGFEGSEGFIAALTNGPFDRQASDG